MENTGISGFNYSTLNFNLLKNHNVGDEIKVLLKDDDYDSYADLVIIEKDESEEYFCGPRVLTLAINDWQKILKWHAYYIDEEEVVPINSFKSNEPNVAGLCYCQYLTFDIDKKRHPINYQYPMYCKIISFDDLKKDAIGTMYSSESPKTNNFRDLFYQSCKLLYKNETGALLKYFTNAGKWEPDEIEIMSRDPHSLLVKINYVWVDFPQK